MSLLDNQLSEEEAAMRQSDMPFSIEPLSSELRFGKVIEGIKAEHLRDEDVRARLRRIWIEDGLVLFRSDEIDEQFHLDLSRIFGPLEQHPVAGTRSAAHPELSTMKSSHTIVELDGVRGSGYVGWHTDLRYVEHINHGGVLRAIRPTETGGITGFIDLIAAYDSLPQDMKDAAEQLNVVYQAVAYDKFRYGALGDFKLIEVADFITKAWDRAHIDFPPVVHPMVFVQPETGRKVLNISPFFAMYIEGKNDEAGHALLKRYCDHICNRPAYRHKWSTRDLILWDNWRMLHSVTPVPLGEERIMQRTNIMGDYGAGRMLVPRSPVAADA